MDVSQVELCQEIIRDNMVTYKNVINCILAITKNDGIDHLSKVKSIRDICITTLDK